MTWKRPFNHRITRRLWSEGTSVDPADPTALLKQGHLEPVAQDRVQVAFEYLQG